mgnify:CR=1 FL=1|tara:strand:- start:3485 stop:5332 length:1848 start_codon:yes stop_codon:yes gene_type:complete
MKKKQQGKINIVNLANYVSPDIRVEKNKDWVTFGDNNSYFAYLLDRYTGSPTNNAIINGISQMIYGKGLDATDSNKQPNEYAQAISLLKKECIRKLVYDLKLMGQCAIQIIYSKDRKKIARIEQMPIETLAMEKCDEDDGEVKAYYYYHDWENFKRGDEPTRIPAFGTSNESIEILYIKPYVAGHYYFSPADYAGGLQYAQLEEEIANFHNSNILNGLAPSMLISFNNGIPNEEERELIERRIYEKYSGSSAAGKFILSFNDSKDNEASIEAVQLSDAHQQYEFLSTESMRKIMVAHRVVSPMLLGIKDQTGLGNNADELKTASTLMDNTVIRPFQELMLEAFDRILAYNGISLNLYFKTLQPLEFTEIDSELVDDETQEEETGVKMSNNHLELNQEEQNILFENLKTSELNNDWEFVDKRNVEEDMISHEDWATICIEPKQNFVTELAGKVIPQRRKQNENTFSYLDKSFYRVRYRYKAARASGNSRDFCSRMMTRFGSDGKPAVYRIEDIDAASKSGVNRQFGHKQKPYDLFRWKGGPYCHHVWEAVLYRLKDKTKPSKFLRNYQETGSIPKTYKPTPYGFRDSTIPPVDMEYGGHHPNWIASVNSNKRKRKK